MQNNKWQNNKIKNIKINIKYLTNKITQIAKYTNHKNQNTQKYNIRYHLIHM